jgi:hypothetical protein
MTSAFNQPQSQSRDASESLHGLGLMPVRPRAVRSRQAAPSAPDVYEAEPPTVRWQP